MDYNPIWYSDTGRDELYELDLDEEFDLDDSAAYLISYLVGDPCSIAELLRDKDQQIAVKADVAGTEYDSSKIIDFEIDNSLARGEELELGTTTPARLTIRLKTNSEIPSNAKITPSFAMMYRDEIVTDWFTLGSFYVDNRADLNGIWTFECYDRLVFADVPYISSLAYPASMQDVWDEICSNLGFAYDSSVVIDPSYNVPVAPTGYTYRQVMSFIAAANAACIFVGRDELIGFKTFTSADMPVITFNRSDCIRAVLTNPVKTYTRVVVTYDVDDELSYDAGVGDDNHTLHVVIPFATQEIADDLLAALDGITYQPFTMDTVGYPILDPGASISFIQLKSVTWEDADIAWQDADFPWDGLSEHKTYALRSVHTFRGGIRSSFEAPSKSEQQSEFKVEGTLSQQIDRINKSAVKQGRLYYGVTISPDYGLSVERSDNKGKAILNADEFRFIADGQDALWFDVPSLRWKFTGTLEGADGVFTGKLEAGEIVGGTIDGTEITAATMNGSEINGSTITGALIQTKAAGSYPRVELSSSGNVLLAQKSATEFLLINPNGPTIGFYGSSFVSGITNFIGLFIESSEGIWLLPDGNVNVQNWGKLRSMDANQTLQTALNGKANAFTGYNGSVSAGSQTLTFLNGVLISVT